ncbi:MarR family transcriptional regulator [Nocardia sp. SYP-A9097]|uniref:MarR family winged helix-turn-helix transcriptional regulator n=1 Tax=Nocardia sp. SYP-A9097 TaxID=2663237 RepID=UPI00129A8057|nr:MarR family transcriptional regulator [Nocardia sp. SYP-A9097]MRH90491.1 MarR family transcriptional regulator [Nocardia sp. SYP-A9097]
MSEWTSDCGHLADELQAVVGALVRQMRAASPDRELPLSQVSILKRLDREGSATVADLARADKIRHQSAATTVAALADRGLLRRTPDPADQRRKLLEITAAGRALLSERREAGSGRLATLIEGRLTATEQGRLADCLPLLYRLLE